MFIANSTGGLMLQTMLYLANQSRINPIYDFPPAAKSSDVNEVKCYGVYGCFPLTGPFKTELRQINVHPQKPSEIQPHFPVFNSQFIDNPNFIDLNEPDRIHDFGINPNAKLFLIVHGYLEAGDRPWMSEMAKKLIDTEIGSSVIMVDWGSGSSPPYVQAVANVRLIGAITAHVIHMIYEELGMINLDNVHMIGHSLGSHLSGYTGNVLQRDFGLKMGRITGLDPAEPLFAETEPIVRLDKSDAKYVDIIHTDANPFAAGGLGMVKAIGHVDFYPNGGFDNPGCNMKLGEYMNNKEKSFFWSIQQFLGCNHIRSHQYFTESILPKCPFNTISCDSYESFKEGKCDKCGENHHNCLQFGYHSNEGYKKLLQQREVSEDTPMVTYLLTSSEKPFCRVHYKITVKVSSSEQSAIHGGEIGTLSLQLHSRKKKTSDKMQFSPDTMYFEPGFEYTTLVAADYVSEPTYATVQWEYSTNLLNPLTWRIISSPRIYVDYIEIQSLETGILYKLCPGYDEPIIAGNENILQINNC